MVSELVRKTRANPSAFGGRFVTGLAFTRVAKVAPSSAKGGFGHAFCPDGRIVFPKGKTICGIEDPRRGRRFFQEEKSCRRRDISASDQKFRPSAGTVKIEHPAGLGVLGPPI